MIMKKSVLSAFSILIIVLVIFLYSPVNVSAEENKTKLSGEDMQKNLAFTWLSKKVADSWPKSPDDISFLLLSLASDSKSRDEGIKAILEKNPGKDSSNVKDSALALLALDNAGYNADYIAKWLLTKKQKYRASNLEWRMQLDSDKKTKCDIVYGERTEEVMIDDNKKMSIKASDNSQCLSVSDDYWIKISSTADNGGCLDRVYEISCDDVIIASIIYKKESIIFVPSKTESSDYVDLEIESKCLADKGGCDFGANLWAAYSLYKTGYQSEIEDLLPYLVSQEDIESDYIPSSFLYMITKNNDYAKKLLEQQDPRGFWNELRYGKWFSTALAYLSLKNEYGFDENITKIKSYILEKQNNEGSWGDSIRDTAFLSYVLWPSYYSGEKIKKEENACEKKGYECNAICDSKNQEEKIEYSASCEDNKVCCKNKEYSPVCTINDDCSKYDCDEFSLLDGCSCEYGIESNCKDKCDNDADGLIDDSDKDCQIPQCETAGYVCCSECEDDHQKKYDYSCENSKCCKECKRDIEICDDNEDNDNDSNIDCKDTDCEYESSCQKKSFVWMYITITILIIAAIAVYIYFNKKKGFNIITFFKSKISKLKKAKPTVYPQQQFQMRQPLLKREAPRSLKMFKNPVKSKEMTETERELERTMKKIRDLNKKE